MKISIINLNKKSSTRSIESKGFIDLIVEEGAGFEPASGINLNTLSKRAT